MEQYISKSALIAEIERRIDELCNYPATEPEEFLAKGASLKPLMELRLFLDTLEVKEVDLEKEIDKEIETRWRGEYLFTSKFRESAKHFFELGLNTKEEVQEEPYAMSDTGSYITTTK